MNWTRDIALKIIGPNLFGEGKGGYILTILTSVIKGVPLASESHMLWVLGQQEKGNSGAILHKLNG